MDEDCSYESLASIDISVAFQRNKKGKAPNNTHGYGTRKNRPPEYNVWSGMKTRCYSQKAEKYPHYGGRGISICDGWRDDFSAFYLDMGPRPSEDHEIDRRDNDGHYSCGKCQQCVDNQWQANCRWVTHSANLRNQSDNRRLTLCGETLCLMEWAERTGLDRRTIADRIDRSGWSVEKALTTPKSPINRHYVRLLTHNGETLSIAEWSKKTGIHWQNISNRLRIGWSVEKTLVTPTLGPDEMNAKYITFNGKTLSYAEWEKETGIRKKLIASRIRMGWSAERTLTTPVIKKTG